MRKKREKSAKRRKGQKPGDKKRERERVEGKTDEKRESRGGEKEIRRKTRQTLTLRNSAIYLSIYLSIPYGGRRGVGVVGVSSRKRLVSLPVAFNGPTYGLQHFLPRGGAPRLHRFT